MHRNITASHPTKKKTNKKYGNSSKTYDSPISESTWYLEQK